MTQLGKYPPIGCLVNTTETSRVARLGPLSRTILFPSIFVSIKQSEVSVCYLSPNSPKRKFNAAQPRSLKKHGKCSFYVVVLLRTAEKPIRLYFARAVSLFNSLTLLFGGVLHDVAVVVFLNSLMTEVENTSKKKGFKS